MTQKKVEDIIIASLKREGIDFVCTLPEDPSANLTNRISKDDFFTYVKVVNEGHGIGITAGASLAGRKAMFVTGIAGLLVSAWQLAETGMYARIPMVLLVSYRGDIGDESVAGTQLYVFGATGEGLLKTLQVPYRIVRNPSEIKASIHDAIVTATRNKTPVALLLTEGALW